MSDESQLQVTPKDSNLSLSLATVRSGLIARGRRDAANLPRPSPPEPTEPLAETRRLAEEGDAEAHYKLGSAYYWGLGVARDFTEAARWLRKAADAGSGSAAEQIGYLYYEGVGVPQDYAEAVKWLRKCTLPENGNPERSEFGGVELCLAKCYFYGLGVQQDYSEATRWLLEALQTDAPAFARGPGNEPYDEIGYLLSCIYSLGGAVKQWCWPAESEFGWQRHSEDAKWHREQAEAGNIASQFCLGLAYAYGLGITRDDAEAVRWWRKAASAGEVWAQLHLAMAYDKGRGVPQDYVHTHMWFNLAASRTTGHHQKYASDARQKVARKMTPQQIADAQHLAREWKPTGSEGRG